MLSTMKFMLFVGNLTVQMYVLNEKKKPKQPNQPPLKTLSGIHLVEESCFQWGIPLISLFC